MTKLKTKRAPRIKKQIKAELDNGTGIVENISASGGFLKMKTGIPTEPFRLSLKISEFKTIKMMCAPQWHNDTGVGFKVIRVEESKEDLFARYIEKQFRALAVYGTDRVFKTEIMVTLKNTNVFGNVYFSNFIEYQGVVREKFLLETVPDLHELMADNNIRLVTVDIYNRYIKNAYFGDTLVVELTTSRIKAATCRLNISFRNKRSGELLSKGYQRICIVSAKGRVMRIPEVFLGPLNFFHEVEE